MLAYGFESQKWTQFTHPTKSIFDHFILVLAFLLYENGQRSLNKNSIGNENPKKVSIDNSIFREIENPVRRFQEILAKTKETRILKELRDPYD
jgi:hypothetical protein